MASLAFIRFAGTFLARSGAAKEDNVEEREEQSNAQQFFGRAELRIMDSGFGILDGQTDVAFEIVSFGLYGLRCV